MAAPSSRDRSNSRPQSGRHPLTLADPIDTAPGVGSRRAAALRKLGIETVGQLLEHFPVRHIRHSRTTIDRLEPGETATILGRITALRARRNAKGPAAVAAVADNTGRCSVTWFNAREFVFDQLGAGAIVEITGKVSTYGGLPQFINPTFRVVPSTAPPIGRNEFETLDAIYPATAGLPSAAIRRLIGALLPLVEPLIEEIYPDVFRKMHKLPDRRNAVISMHRPASLQQAESARHRLAFDELLLMQLAVQMARRRRRECFPAHPLRCTPEIDQRIRQRMPFTLTPAQDRVAAEITADLARTTPMNRMLQGDVGCGKTVVAVYAALLAIANGRQVALLAPTELLARQHDATIAGMLRGSRVRQALCVGGGKPKERRAFRAALVAGELDLVVGTQAVLEPDVTFRQLGLVIVDEQHRFGVKQRTTIISKGHAPHYLVMTATPIPRTLAMTVFGDLDISTIDAPPPGRAAIKTRIIQPHEVAHAWRFIASRVAAGEQAYVVYPIVTESEALSLRAATTEARRIESELLPSVRVGLLHGRLSDEEKQSIMSDFAAGRIAVLVATTVIEVGIDVPNATVLLVQHAERYGLAQLHQLRGRVGRGGKPGYCYLAIGDKRPDSDDDSASHRPPTPTDRRAAAGSEPNRPVPRFKLPNARADGRPTPPDDSVSSRLSILTRTTDGFEIAEEDLRQRGPGELLGVRQHGLPSLRVADLGRDLNLLMHARAIAAGLLAADPDLQAADWQRTRQVVIDRFAAGMRFLAGA